MECSGRSLCGCIRVVQVVRRRMCFDCLPPSSAVQFHPVVFAVLDLTCVLQSLCEKISQEVVVGGVLKSEIPYIAKILVELFCDIVSSSSRMTCWLFRTWQTFAKILNGCRLLLLANLLVLLLVGGSLETLPG